MMKKISVLVTTYNAAKFLPTSIISVLNQTYKDFELVIIDDGSSDNTEKAIKSLQDDRIMYYKIEHTGRSKALNYGLQKCTNDWVALMDADDICDRERLEKQINNFSFNFNSISCTWSAYFDNKGIKFTVDTPIDIIKLKENFLLHSYICNPSVIYNRNFILNKGGYDERFTVFEDYELWLRLLNEIRFEIVPEHLLFIRYNQNSLSYKGLNNKNHIVREIQDKYYEIGNHIFGVNKTAENKLRGWREYFYGSKKKARNFWMNQPNTFYDFKVIIAFIFTFMPVSIMLYLKRFQLKYKIKLLISPDYSKLKNKFEHTKKAIGEYVG